MLPPGATLADTRVAGISFATQLLLQPWPGTATCVPHQDQGGSYLGLVACGMQARPGEPSNAWRLPAGEPGAASTRARSVHGAARSVARERYLLLSGRRNLRRFRRRR